MIFSRPSRLPLCQGQRHPVQCRSAACFAREVEDQDPGNLTLNQCLSWSRRDVYPGHVGTDAFVRPSQAKLGRFPSRRREFLISQAQEKKGQTRRRVYTTRGQNATRGRGPRASGVGRAGCAGVGARAGERAVWRWGTASVSPLQPPPSRI